MEMPFRLAPLKKRRPTRRADEEFEADQHSKAVKNHRAGRLNGRKLGDGFPTF